jgi:hypothetical protein
MPKRTWGGSGNVVERVDVTIGVAQILKVPRPPHPYGSPAQDLKRDEAAARAREDEAKTDETK